MSAEPVLEADAGAMNTVEDLAEELARFKDVFWHGSTKDARALIAEMAQKWPDSERVQRLARVLTPPVARSVREPARSSERETDWLREHAREYPGCWIAVRGDHLVAADPDLKAVTDAIRSNPEHEGAVLYFKVATESRGAAEDESRS